MTDTEKEMQKEIDRLKALLHRAYLELQKLKVDYNKAVRRAENG